MNRLPPLVSMSKIIHVDMDMFYAAVELRDRPELRGKPLVVGGSPQSRSVVTTATYEARRFGIHSGMSCAEAQRRCPRCIFLPPDFAKYQEVSDRLYKIFLEFSDRVEMVSLDEAYLDVTENKLGEASATRVAVQIKKRIRAETGLTASAGVGPSMFVAKIASDINKPDGLCVVRPEQVTAFIRPLAVGKIPGVGKVSEGQLRGLGIHTIADLAEKPLQFLEKEFGKFGRYLHDIARGLDERQVTPFRERQSYGAEETFAQDILDVKWLESYLRDCASRVFYALQEEGKAARTVTLKIKYFDFQVITRRKTFPDFLHSAEEVFQAALELLTRTEAGKRKIRLAGIALSNFLKEKQKDKAEQPPLPF